MIAATSYRTARRAFSVAPAAPAGGAHPSGRGRGRGFGVAAGIALGATAAAAQGAVPVPSGQEIHLQEVLLDGTPGELWVRFRFVAPGIGRNAGDIGYDVSAVDMDHLCTHLALPYLAERGLKAARVVISLSDHNVPFGATDRTATQFFEAYRPENTRCIWEEF